MNRFICKIHFWFKIKSFTENTNLIESIKLLNNNELLNIIELLIHIYIYIERRILMTTVFSLIFFL